MKNNVCFSHMKQVFFSYIFENSFHARKKLYSNDNDKSMTNCRTNPFKWQGHRSLSHKRKLGCCQTQAEQIRHLSGSPTFKHEQKVGWRTRLIIRPLRGVNLSIRQPAINPFKWQGLRSLSHKRKLGCCQTQIQLINSINISNARCSLGSNPIHSIHFQCVTLLAPSVMVFLGPSESEV